MIDMTPIELDELELQNKLKSDGFKNTPCQRKTDKAIDAYLKEIETSGDIKKAERKFFDAHK